LSPEDEYKLDQLRLQRFRQLFAQALAGCLLSPPVLGKLIIVCQAPAQVDAVLADWPEMLYFGYAVCGADRLGLYFAGEEVWSEETIAPVPQSIEAINL
jgi:hypothetical protein